MINKDVLVGILAMVAANSLSAEVIRGTGGPMSFEKHGIQYNEEVHFYVNDRIGP